MQAARKARCLPTAQPPRYSSFDAMARCRTDQGPTGVAHGRVLPSLASSTGREFALDVREERVRLVGAMVEDVATLAEDVDDDMADGRVVGLGWRYHPHIHVHPVALNVMPCE